MAKSIQLHSIAKTSDLLGIGRTLIYRLIADGKLEVVKIGNCTRITNESIRALIETNKRVHASNG